MNPGPAILRPIKDRRVLILLFFGKRGARRRSLERFPHSESVGLLLSGEGKFEATFENEARNVHDSAVADRLVA